MLKAQENLPQSPQKLVDMIMNCLANSFAKLQRRPANTASGVPKPSVSSVVMGLDPLNAVMFVDDVRGVNQNLMNVGLHSITTTPPPWLLKPLNILLVWLDSTEQPSVLRNFLSLSST
jgi:hypothetical protein